MEHTPVIDFSAEANEVCVQAVPGAVFLRLRRAEGEAVVRRMFIEMTPQEARDLVRELQASVRVAERRMRA